MSTDAPTDAGVVIATRNRRDDARRAIASAAAQRPRVPILVVDDASDDGTDEMVRREFPRVRLLRSRRPMGPAAARTWGVEQCEAEVVVLIDDDAHLPDPSTVQRTLEEFDHPRVGAVAVPYEEAGKVQQRAPEGSRGIVATDYFVGAAHAVRRDVFLELGGYRASLVIYTEEPDLCLRMLAAGYITRLGAAPPAVHIPNPRRDNGARFARLLRNETLFKWYHTPAGYLPLVLGGHVLAVGRRGVARGCPRAAAAGLWAGARGMLREFHQRHPVPTAVYRLWRDLRRHRALPLAEIEGRLPPMRFSGQPEPALPQDVPEPAAAIDPA